MSTDSIESATGSSFMQEAETVVPVKPKPPSQHREKKEQTILIVDDSISTCVLLRHILNRADYRSIKLTHSAEEAFESLFCEKTPLPDLILMDFHMGEIDGVRAIEILKADASLQDIPIIMVTGKKGLKNLDAALDVGANDYITKPVQPTELIARARSALRLRTEIEARKERESKLQMLTDQLEEANRQLHIISRQDGLTQIANRRFLDERLAEECSRGFRSKTPVSLLMIDVDYFKKFNDNYGHRAGDQCLISVGNALKKSIARASDFVARFGGEEFVIVLPETKTEGAIAVAQRASEAIERERIPHEYSPFKGMLTVSIGIATACPKVKILGASPEAFDIRLYELETKQASGN